MRRLCSELDQLYGGDGYLAFGIPLYELSRDPLDVLVMAILSQNTTDANARRAFDRLKEAFPTWEGVRDAPLDEVQEAIAVGGLAPTRAPRIKRILERLTADTGRCSLDFLAEMDTREAMNYLTGLQGVGPKTAACVLLFALERPVLPVDTHILRICRRLGLVRPGAGPVEAQSILQDACPPEWVLPLHVYLIRHGRRVCKARNPDCGCCPFEEGCRFRR